MNILDKIVFHMRLNLMFVVVAILLFILGEENKLYFYYTLNTGVVFLFIFAVETVFGIINHDDYYTEDN